MLSIRKVSVMARVRRRPDMTEIEVGRRCITPVLDVESIGIEGGDREQVT